jgi:glucose-6-phosphate isomerase
MRVSVPQNCQIDLTLGTMSGATGRYQKKLKDLAGLYADAVAFAALAASHGDQVVYDVADFRPSAAPGDMIFGVTRMSPGRVGDEFFMTRGHIHAQTDRPEVYYGQKGRGLMQLESPDGETRVLEIGAQTVCYVPPYWIHRSINIGNEDLVMMFCYPADAGQDYGIIEQSQGMRHRVMADGSGKWRLVENPVYRARAAETVTALLQPAR